MKLNRGVAGQCFSELDQGKIKLKNVKIFFDFSLTVKAAPHECVIRTGQS